MTVGIKEPSYDEKIAFVVVESLCDATISLFGRLDLKTRCSMHTLANHLRSSHKDT